MISGQFDVFDEFAGPVEATVQSASRSTANVRSVLGDISNRAKSKQVGLKGESDDKLSQLKPATLKPTQKFTLQSLLPRQPVEPRGQQKQQFKLSSTTTQQHAPENGLVSAANHGPAFASLDITQIMASKQVAAKYIQEAQTRLINYSHSSGALARTNNELNTKLRNFTRTQKVLEFRISHLTQLQQDQKNAHEQTQNEYQSLIESVRESNRTLQIEHRLLQERMHDTLSELTRAKANTDMIKLEKTKQEIDTNNDNQPQQQHEEEKQRLHQLLSDQETNHKAEQERLRAELAERSKALEDVEARHREASEQIQVLQEGLTTMTKMLSEMEERTQAAVKTETILEDELTIVLRLKDDLRVELDEEREESDSLLGACDILKSSNEALRESLMEVIRELTEIKSTHVHDLKQDLTESSM